MLPLLLTLLSDPLVPQAAVPLPNAEPPVLVLGTFAEDLCGANRFQRVARPAERSGSLMGNLMYSPDDEVRSYLLLDRSIGGCPAPISYAVPYRQDDSARQPAPEAPRETMDLPSYPPRSSE